MSGTFGDGDTGFGCAWFRGVAEESDDLVDRDDGERQDGVRVAVPRGGVQLVRGARGCW